MTQITLKKATIKDELLIYNWFNNKENLSYKIKTKKKISLRTHTIWIKRFFKERLGCILIINFQNKAIGNIRLSNIKKKNYEVDIFIDKKYRNLNIASSSLQRLEKKLEKGTIIYSYIKKNNLKSMKFFKKNNYLLFKSTKNIWYLKKSI